MFWSATRYLRSLLTKYYSTLTWVLSWTVTFTFTWIKIWPCKETKSMLQYVESQSKSSSHHVVVLAALTSLYCALLGRAGVLFSWWNKGVIGLSGRRGVWLSAHPVRPEQEKSRHHRLPVPVRWSQGETQLWKEDLRRARQKILMFSVVSKADFIAKDLMRALLQKSEGSHIR